MREAILIALMCWMVFGCVACGTTKTFLDDVAEQASTDNPFQQTHAAMLDGAEEQVVYSRATITHTNQLADVLGGLPIVVPPDTRPMVGVPFTVGWTTRPTASFPNRRTALVVSLRPPPEPALIPGGGGGTLMLHPDFVFEPNKVPWLTQYDGEVRLDFTFAQGLLGLRIWMQLLVDDDRVPGRAIGTPLLVLTVGNR